MRTTGTGPLSVACDQCPWRKANQGKHTPWGFYNKANLTRLWRQIRGGGARQSCHPTDPSHPDHIAAGAKPGAAPRECPGSVILIFREMERMKGPNDLVDGDSTKAYLKSRRKGLTKTGIMYWLISRFKMGDTPFFGEGKLPNVDVDDPEIGLPEYLES
jgi:hypothetical protein